MESEKNIIKIAKQIIHEDVADIPYVISFKKIRACIYVGPCNVIMFLVKDVFDMMRMI